MAERLLDTAQIESIKDALEDVTFTFFVEPITYFQWKESLDRWNEDRDKKAQFTEHALKGLVEFGTLQSDSAVNTPVGRVDDQSIKVSFNFRDLKALGLTKDNSTVMNVAVDTFSYEGVKYSLDSVRTEGFFNDEPVLVLISGTRQEQKT